ncbi:LysE family translocator [Pelomonas sp. SE-A7]|uniref:LysE family translocator n=1 Tax=Pelomonas sp. SE-A7 TaxID=3054953 RepID=UPI00259CEB99|nr:LysE family translocator [Pelomonas sp. SE-A7]MDM4765879.1 LysE family translocator [Pelomonas sp. SE-A7]
MKLYLLFLLMASATVLSPGPGVLMTLSNALRSGWRASLPGILGIASGATIVAAISATSLGLLLASSALAFTLIKILGALYLVWLGLKLWRSPGLALDEAADLRPPRSAGALFLESLTLQFTNPKAIFFFLSVLPQFIDHDRPHTPQFALLVLSYAVLVILIHSGYALCAQRARHWLKSPRGGRTLNRIGGGTFMAFGGLLALSRN